LGKIIEQILEIGNVNISEAGAWCRLTIPTRHTSPNSIASVDTIGRGAMPGRIFRRAPEPPLHHGADKQQ
jgi:hypothetical protein